MRVKDLMKASLACRPGTDLATASRLMGRGNCEFLPVIGADGEVVGLVTEHDISMAVGAHHLTAVDLRVAEVMEPTVPSCREEDTVEDAAASMTGSGPRCFVVTDSLGRLRGVLPADDLLQAAARPGNAGGTRDRRG